MPWTCPECGKSFRNTNQWHSCYIIDIEIHLRNKSAIIKDLYHRLESIINKFGTIEINPIKTAIQFRSGATFLTVRIRPQFLELEFQLDREVDLFPVHKKVKISGKRTLHFVYIQDPADVNDQLISWLNESYLLVKDY